MFVFAFGYRCLHLYLHLLLYLFLFLFCMHAYAHACISVCSLAKGSCNGFAAWRGGPSMICARRAEHRRNSEFFIAMGVRNCFASLRKGAAMIWLHCKGVLECFWFDALRRVLAMLELWVFAKWSCNGWVLLYCEGGLQWLLV